MDNDNLQASIKDFIANAPEVEIDNEYFELEDKFKALFGHRIPREQLPTSITKDMIKDAMKKCIETNEDKLYELLNVKFIDGAIY